MMRIEDLPDKEQKPFLANATSIDALFTHKLNTESFLDFLLAGTHHFTNTPKAVFNQALPPNFQHKILTNSLVVQYTVEERISSFGFHLTARIVLQDMDLRPYTKEEGVLAERESG